MTAIGIKRLRDLAEKATPGPRRAMRAGNQYIDGRLVGASNIEGLKRPFNVHSIRLVNIEQELGSVRFTDEDADFIAACDPATILALIEELEEFRAAAIQD